MIGRVNNDLRAVYVKIDNKIIYLYMIFDGEISDYWSETAAEIGTEIIADFYEFDIEEYFIRKDYPEILNYPDCVCIYKRFE
ncbi:hypothetical protein [Acinetobacter sp. ANC 4639]